MINDIRTQVYDSLIVDTMNMLHRLKTTDIKKPELVGEKKVYKDLVRDFILLIEQLKGIYLKPGGEVYLLFDNPTSRISLQKAFYNVDRKQISSTYKEGRKKESKEFYYSLDLIKYYFLSQDSSYKCAQISNLEADDLVKPLLESELGDKDNLMITNDYDWTRYLSKRTHWLKEYKGEPITPVAFYQEHGFYPTENSIIAYKSLFGDSSDGIPNLIHKTKDHLRIFKEIYNKTPELDPKNLLFFPDVERKENKEFFDCITKEQYKFKINIQLTSSMKVDQSHFQKVLNSGRNAVLVTESVEKILGLRELQASKSFQFGNVKPPRV
jgi:hypothetical protein